MSDRIRLLGVFAHPDDDVYTMGGTWAVHRERLDVTLVFCTSGDAGPIWVEGIATRETLGAVREGEQAASMAALGVQADVRFLRFPDARLGDVAMDDLVDQIDEVVREVRPHAVVTFGNDGVTGHADHVQAGAAADRAFDRGEHPDASSRLLHVAVPRSVAERYDRDLRAAGDPDREARSLLAMRGVPDDRITYAVDTRPVGAAKLAAIEAHRTQIGELERVPEHLRGIFFETEWFAQVRPAAPAGAAAGPDPFAGLA